MLQKHEYYANSSKMFYLHENNTHTHTPVLEVMPFLEESSCRSKHTIVPKIMRAQPTSVSRLHSRDQSLESDQNTGGRMSM